MISRHIHHLPVTRQGQLVGMITATDLMNQEGRNAVNLSSAIHKASAAEEMAPVQADLAGITVLCVDDNPAILEGMLELMSSWQCEVYGAISVGQAKEIFVQQPDIDILLVDYQLCDELDGLALIAQLRQLQPDIPAILITATTEANIEHKAEVAQVGLLRKLVKPAALRAMMSAQLSETLQSQLIR
jgi:CheY-like chemotaxis protein